MRPIAALWVLLGACSGGAPSATGPTGSTLRIGGSETLTQRLIPALADSFRRGRSDVAVEVVPAGSSEGFAELLDGEVDLAAATRPALASEEEQAKVLGFSLHGPESRHLLGVDVVAVAVHPSNPTESLTYDQVIGIFCNRSVDSWSFLGLEDRPVKVLSRAPDSGTRALFEDFFCGPRGIDESVPVADAAQIAAALRDDPDTIAFVSLSEGVGKLVGLRPEPTAPPVRPSQQNIIRGAYPLYRDVMLISRGPATGAAAAFLAFAASPGGQEIVDEQRFVPLFLRPQQLDEPRPLRETIHFEPGAAEPNQRSLARLQLLVQELRERQLRHVVLEGYTDDSEAEPFGLSQQRAETVRSLLAAEMPELYFEIIPRGARNPIAPNDTPYGRQRNRRVQVYLAEDEGEKAAGG